MTNLDPRYDAEGDEFVRALFSEEDLKMSPEEYAARHGHEWLCFGLPLYRFRDPALGEWIRRLGEILFDKGDALERCRLRYLTPEELAEVRRRAAEEP